MEDMAFIGIHSGSSSGSFNSIAFPTRNSATSLSEAWTFPILDDNLNGPIATEQLQDLALSSMLASSSDSKLGSICGPSYGQGSSESLDNLQSSVFILMLTGDDQMDTIRQVQFSITLSNL